MGRSLYYSTYDDETGRNLYYPRANETFASLNERMWDYDKRYPDLSPMEKWAVAALWNDKHEVNRELALWLIDTRKKMSPKTVKRPSLRGRGIHVVHSKLDHRPWGVLEIVFYISTLLRLFNVKREAVKWATERAKTLRIELYIHGRDGKIQSRNSYGKDSPKRKG
jgi:hypothetical protein